MFFTGSLGSIPAEEADDPTKLFAPKRPKLEGFKCEMNVPQ